MVKFGYRTRRHSAQLILNGKYTILTGVSGSGKTLLAQRLRQISTVLASDVSYTGPAPIYVFENTLSSTSFQDVLSASGALVVVDEESDILCDDAQRQLLLQSNNYYLFITRDGLEGIPYGVDDIFELEGPLDSLRMVPAYRAERSHLSQRVTGTVVCEGSGVDYSVISKKLSGTRVVSAGGKNNVVQAVYSSQASLALVDWCGTAFATKRLMNLVLVGKVSTIFSPSFEYELLANQWLCGKEGLVVREMYEVNALDFKSEEDFYTKCVDMGLHARYGLAYSKSGSSVLAELVCRGTAMIGNNLIKGEPQPVKLDWLYPELQVGVSRTVNKLKLD